ncbi:hypothetical protein, partial [Casimicrobium huifangae]|uniref:hypothetical protein n=1 Tax=Casimicrobium huifangae TaxID=2591109 RepID=UPI003784B3BB
TFERKPYSERADSPIGAKSTYYENVPAALAKWVFRGKVNPVSGRQFCCQLAAAGRFAPQRERALS